MIWLLSASNVPGITTWRDKGEKSDYISLSKAKPKTKWNCFVQGERTKREMSPLVKDKAHPSEFHYQLQNNSWGATCVRVVFIYIHSNGVVNGDTENDIHRQQAYQIRGWSKYTTLKSQGECLKVSSVIIYGVRMSKFVYRKAKIINKLRMVWNLLLLSGLQD